MSKNKKSSKTLSHSFSLTPDITKKEKVKRAKYLSNRINDLYSNISEWIKNDYSIKKSSVTIEDVKLPAADIFLEKKLIVSLKPTGLWGFGVNCRIDILADKEPNIIFDIAKESDPPDWELISAEPGKRSKKLSKIIFRNLLKKIYQLK